MGLKNSQTYLPTYRSLKVELLLQLIYSCNISSRRDTSRTSSRSPRDPSLSSPCRTMASSSSGPIMGSISLHHRLLRLSDDPTTWTQLEPSNGNRHRRCSSITRTVNHHFRYLCSSSQSPDCLLHVHRSPAPFEISFHFTPSEMSLSPRLVFYSHGRFSPTDR